MSSLDKFESGIEDAIENAGARVFKGTIQPAQIARQAEKQMKREKLIGSGKQHAPTLYTVLVNDRDDKRLFAFYPTMAAEIETHLMSRGADTGLSFDGRPLVRFIVDKKLKSGRFDVIAEHVAALIIEQLRAEEAEYLGLKPTSEAKADEPGDNLRAQLRQAHAVSGQPERQSGEQSSFPELDGDSVGEPVTTAGANRSFADSDSDAVGTAIGNACLIDSITGQRYALTLSRMTIGRDEVNDIVLNDANASRRHAYLRQNVLGTWRVVDLQSTNGTLVNGRVVDQMVLREHDLLTIGVTALEFFGGSVPGEADNKQTVQDARQT